MIFIYFNLLYRYICINNFYFFQNSFDVLCTIFINLILTLSGYNSINFSNDNKQNSLVLFPLALVTFSKKTSKVIIIMIMH